jgi:hypothetical protein
VEKLEGSVQRIQSIFDSGLKKPCKHSRENAYRDTLVELSGALQDLYNLIDTALGLLRGYHKEDKTFLADLEYELLGKKQAEQFSLRGANAPFVVVKGYSGNQPYYWKFIQKLNPEGGILVVMEALRSSMGFDHGSEFYAARIRSAYQAFQQTIGAIKRLESRLSYTVMYPDTISKDALSVRENLKKHNLDDIWMQFNAGLDNFRNGDLLGSTNRIANSLTSFIRAAAQKYGYKGGQIGTHTIFLEKIGYVHDYMRQMISNFYGYLSKFRKGVEPTLDEARLLVDLAFSLFGFLVPHMDSFSVSEESAKAAKKETRALVTKQKQEDAKRTLSKE